MKQGFSRNTGDRFEKETTSRTFTGEGLQQSNLQYQQPTLYSHPSFQQSSSLQNQPMSQTSSQQFQQRSLQASNVQNIVEPTIVQEKPVVIHERIRKEEVEEIQPIIHREHERLEVHQILQPMVEQIVQPTVITERSLAAETRPLVNRGGYMGCVAPQGTTDVQNFHKVVEKAPIFVDCERRKVLEEIQPVVYKEILQPTIIRETKDIYEKVIEAPLIFTKTLPQQYIGKAQTQFEPLSQNVLNLSNQNLQSSSLQSGLQSGFQSQGFQGQNLQYRQNQPGAFSQRETVDRWISPAPLSSARV